jgi:hypothetical protein
MPNAIRRLIRPMFSIKQLEEGLKQQKNIENLSKHKTNINLPTQILEI